MMKKLLLIGLVAGGMSFAAVPRSDAQVYFSIGFGPGYYGYYYPYRYYRPYYGYYRPEGKSRLFIERSSTNREICDIAEVSSVIRGMRGYEIHRLCFPVEATEAIDGIR